MQKIVVLALVPDLTESSFAYLSTSRIKGFWLWFFPKSITISFIFALKISFDSFTAENWPNCSFRSPNLKTVLPMSDKVNTNLLLIGGNVVELHHPSGLLSDVPGEKPVYLRLSKSFITTELCGSQRNMFKCCLNLRKNMNGIFNNHVYYS